MASYDPQVEAKAIAELQRLTAELKAANEAFQANQITIEQYDAAIRQLQPQMAALRDTTTEMAKAAEVSSRAGAVAERAAQVQARAAQQAAEVVAKAAQSAAEIQAKAAEQAAVLQQRGAEKAAAVQQKAATEAADHQAKEAQRAAAIQGTDAQKAADIQAAAAQKAADIQAKAAQAAADIQASHAQMAAEKQAKEAKRAEGIQERAANYAAKVQAEAAQRAANIQEAEATRAANVQAREATRAATVQAAQQEAAAARIIAAEKSKTAAVEAGATAAKDATGKNAIMMFQLGQAVEDLQYGFHGVINNLVFIAAQRGWSGPLILGLTLAGVAVNQLIKHWDTLVDRFKGGLPLNQFQTATERLNARLDETKSKLEALSKQSYLDPTEVKQYNSLREETLRLEQLITDETEKQARLKALESMQTLEERQRARAFDEVVGEKGGAAFKELERVVAERLERQKEDIYRKRQAEIDRREKALESGELTKHIPLQAVPLTLQTEREQIDKLKQSIAAERAASNLQAKDAVARAAQGKDSAIQMLADQFPAERDLATGGYKTATPQQRAGALLDDVRNVEMTGKTQRQLNAEGDAHEAEFRRKERAKERQKKEDREREIEADLLDEMELQREQARERAQRALNMGRRPDPADENAVRRPWEELGQHRRDAAWDRMEAEGEAARRQDQEAAQRRRAGPLPQRGPILPGPGMNPAEQFAAWNAMSPAEKLQQQRRAIQDQAFRQKQELDQQLLQAIINGDMASARNAQMMHQDLIRRLNQATSQINFMMQQWNQAQFRRPPGGATMF